MAKALRLTQIERKEISDSKMLEAAIDLIVEKGTNELALKEVSERAGYSRGLAGYRFGNKVGLFDFVLRSVGDEWLAELMSVTKNKSGYEAVASALDAHSQFCEDAPKHVEAFYRLWFESLTPNSPLRSLVVGIHDRRTKDVKGWIDQGVEAGLIIPVLPAHLIADQFSASIIGIIYQWINSPTNIKEIQGLHNGLKQTMQLMLCKSH
ncbi:TetR/AcrR family transcriptional regulator [Porticoccaceae bacterium nBUS_17]